jgi:hypothetical protein
MGLLHLAAINNTEPSLLKGTIPMFLKRTTLVFLSISIHIIRFFKNFISVGRVTYLSTPKSVFSLLALANLYKLKEEEKTT